MAQIICGSVKDSSIKTTPIFPTKEHIGDCIIISSHIPNCIEVSVSAPACIVVNSSLSYGDDNGCGGDNGGGGGVLEPTPNPELSGIICTEGNTSIIITIDNYDESFTYFGVKSSLDPFGADVTQDGDTLIWDFDADVWCDHEYQIAVKALGENMEISGYGYYTVVGMCETNTIYLSGTNLCDEGDLVVVTIDNYDATYTYSNLTVTNGTVTREDDKIYWQTHRITSSIEQGAELSISANSPDECTFNTDSQHTLNIYDDGKTGTVNVTIDIHIEYIAPNGRVVQRVDVDSESYYEYLTDWDYCRPPDIGGSHRYINYSYNYDTEVETPIYGTVIPNVCSVFQEYFVIDFKQAYPYL